LCDIGQAVVFPANENISWAIELLHYVSDLVGIITLDIVVELDHIAEALC